MGKGKNNGRGKRLPVTRNTIKRIFDHTKPSSNRERSCGSCTACCTALKVRIDGPDGPNTVVKPEHEACQHLRKLKAGQKGGCGVYDSRPFDCRIYKCYWLEGFGEIKDRPDRLGMILDTADGIIPGIYALVGVRCLSIHESRPGAHRGERFKAVITGLLNQKIGIFYHGTGDIPAVMAVGDTMTQINAALAVLEDASKHADAHAAGAHAVEEPLCPACAGVCPAHAEDPSPLCVVCSIVRNVPQPVGGGS